MITLLFTIPEITVFALLLRLAIYFWQISLGLVLLFIALSILVAIVKGIIINLPKAIKEHPKIFFPIACVVSIITCIMINNMLDNKIYKIGTM